MAVKILGAGPAGLCAAINLASAGEKARVFEMQHEVGMRFHPNLQGLRYVPDPEKFMKSMGVHAKLQYRHFPKAFVCTRGKDLELDISEGNQMPFVARGGRDSLEYAMYLQAEKMGVDFEFGSRIGEKEARIIATGVKKPDYAAVGSVFEDTSFPRDHYLVMYDDRYSPKGWYSYMIPISGDLVEFVTCVSRPYIPGLAKFHQKAMQERKIIRDFVAGKKKAGMIGGAGESRLPKSAVCCGRYYVGEAAGFQDPFMGFGIVYALKSGKLAADTILGKESDYDAAWKREILPSLKKDYARRFPMSIFGDFVPQLVMSQYQGGNEKVDFGKAIPEENPVYPLVQELFFRLEMAKKQATGEW